MSSVLSLLEAASAALTKATLMVRETVPLPPSPALSAISHDLEGYVFDESLYADPQKTWYVPDFNELFVDVALSNGTYGISIGSYSIFMNDKLGASEEVRGPLGYCLVDKEGWTEAKDMAVGDVLYMMNHKTGKALRGIITGQPVKGPFCSMRSLENSFVACLGMFADVDLRREVEIVFKVDWTEHSDLNTWTKFLECIDENKVTLLP